MSAELIAARNAALERGDKALAREIYHQLVGNGYRPEDIDAGVATTTVAEDSYVAPDVDEPVAAEVEPEPDVAAPAPARPKRERKVVAAPEARDE